jgi:hypothetical protein
LASNARWRKAQAYERGFWEGSLGFDRLAGGNRSSFGSEEFVSRGVAGNAEPEAIRLRASASPREIESLALNKMNATRRSGSRAPLWNPREKLFPRNVF